MKRLRSAGAVPVIQNIPTMSALFPILLIDDDPLLLDILVQAAKTSFPEASFQQALSLQQAPSLLTKPDQGPPRLVLLDLDMSEQMNGINFLAVLRAQAQTRMLPVVMLTISQLPVDVQTAYANGASWFAIKPADYKGWITFISNLRLQWFSPVTLPLSPGKGY